MSRQLNRLWLIAYDIQDHGDRRRIHNILKNHGQRVQYSVFECWLKRDALNRLRKTLQQEIQPGDSIRWYPLCNSCRGKIDWQGKGQQAEDTGYYLP